MKNEHVFASRNINKDMSITNKERFYLWMVEKVTCKRYVKENTDIF